MTNTDKHIPLHWKEHLAGGDDRLPKNRAEQRDEVVKAMYDLADAMSYPQDQHGNTIDLTYIVAPIAYHLALAGARVHPDKALIKQRLVPGQGVVDGSVEWVGIDEPDPEPDQDPSRITLADLANMPPAQQAAAMQKLGIAAQPDPSAGWHTKTKITTEEEPES